jgi:berberine-like enzyme
MVAMVACHCGDAANAEADLKPLRQFGPPETEQNIAWAKQTFEALRPCMTDRSYVNNLIAEDGRKVHEVWGANYHRLVTVKRRYDPGNVFRLNHNIEP